MNHLRTYECTSSTYTAVSIHMLPTRKNENITKYNTKFEFND